MLYPTHAAGGMAAGLMMTNGNFGVTETLIITLTAGIAGLLPDLDSPGSYVGSWVPAFHSLVAGAVGIVLATTGFKVLGLSHNGILLNAFLAGYFSHLFLDALTPEGVPLLWPLKVKIGLPLVKTGGMIEKLVVFPALFGWVLLQLYSTFGGGLLL